MATTTTTAANPSSKPEAERSERLPHERDESADAQQASPEQKEIGEKAFDHAASKRADTSLGPVTDDVYRELKRR